MQVNSRHCGHCFSVRFSTQHSDISNVKESGPWKLSNTLIPIAVSASFPLIKHAIILQKLPEYNWR
jgi:hypothetical protein